MPTLLENIANVANALGGAYNSNRANSQVQSAIGQNTGVVNNTIKDLQSQIAASRAQAEQQYAAAQGQVGTQNAALSSQADTLAQQLAALSDPNSAYMQNARTQIERKDAAAGRRSQWGEREVQLQGTLADYVGRYAPGLNNSITGARNQISQNNQGLASLFANTNAVPDRNTQTLVQLLQQQLAGATAANTTGRQAANSNTNNLMGLARTVGGLFNGSNENGSSTGLTEYYQPSVANGITGYDVDFGGGYDPGFAYGGWGDGGGYYGDAFGGGSNWFDAGSSGGFDYGSGGILDNSLWN